MADSKISQLPEATLPLNGNDLIPIVQTSNSTLTTRKVKLEALANLVEMVPISNAEIDSLFR